MNPKTALEDRGAEGRKRALKYTVAGATNGANTSRFISIHDAEATENWAELPATPTLPEANKSGRIVKLLPLLVVEIQPEANPRPPLSPGTADPSA